MPSFLPPRVPETPDFLDRVEQMLRRVARERVRVPRLRRFNMQFFTAPAGSMVMAVLAVAFFLNASLVETVTPDSLPHWTAPATTVTTVAPETGHGSATRRVSPTPPEPSALIDGQFARSELRVEADVELPTASTVPQ